MKLDPFHPYSSTNKGRTRNHQYGGKHDNGLVERGDDKLSTLVTTRPWLFNTMDVSPVTRHTKPWDIKPEEVGRLYEPHYKRYGPTLPGGRRPSVRSYLDTQ